jgi:hypothetical protein
LHFGNLYQIEAGKQKITYRPELSDPEEPLLDPELDSEVVPLPDVDSELFVSDLDVEPERVESELLYEPDRPLELSRDPVVPDCELPEPVPAPPTDEPVPPPEVEERPVPVRSSSERYFESPFFFFCMSLFSVCVWSEREPEPDWL